MIAANLTRMRRTAKGPWARRAQRAPPDAHGHAACESVYVKHAKRADPRGQRVASWLPGAEGEGR